MPHTISKNMKINGLKRLLSDASIHGTSIQGHSEDTSTQGTLALVPRVSLE